MALKAAEIRQLGEALGKELAGRRILKASLYGERALFLDLQGKGEGRLALVLDNQEPRAYLADSLPRFKPIEGHFAEIMRKELTNARILSVSSLNEDRILVFSLRVTNAVFKEERRTLVFEMIPRQANVILLGEDKRILVSHRPGTLQDERPLIRGMRYVTPKKPEISTKIDLDFDVNSYFQHCLALEEELRRKRKKDMFGSLIKGVERKIRQLEKKEERLQEDRKKALEHSQDGRLGELIYTYWDEIPAGATSFETEGVTIPLDPRKTLSQNAEAFYKRAKKAKETARYSEKFLEEALREKEELSLTLAQLEASDEAGLEAMAKDLGILGVARPGKKERPALGSATLPYLVSHNGVSYLFGKNARQNDCLTFLYCTAKNHLWFHVMGDSGSHLILKKDGASEEEKLFAAELVLLASKKEEGDVMCALRKAVTKGSAPGEAKVREFETIHVRKISEEARRAFEGAIRWIPNRS